MSLSNEFGIYQTGILFQSKEGQGKTSILKQLQEELGNSCAYVDLCAIMSRLGLSTASHIQLWIRSNISSGVKIFLIDNIDGDGYINYDSLETRILFACLIHVIDDIRFRNQLLSDPSARISIIGSCTSIERLPPGITLPYRMGSPYMLDAPDIGYRVMLLRSVSDLLPIPITNASITELAQAFQGQFASTMANQIRNQNLRHSGNIPNKMLSANNYHESRSFPDAVSAQGPPELVGLESVQNRLLARLMLPTTTTTTITTEPVSEMVTTEMCEGNASMHKPNMDRAILRKLLGIKPCSGILIEGPSGCGKTALKDWIVAKSRGKYRCITISCADLVHKVVGESERMLVQLFDEARKMAPCFLVLDNIETILGSNDDKDKDIAADVASNASQAPHDAPVIAPLSSSFFSEPFVFNPISRDPRASLEGSATQDVDVQSIKLSDIMPTTCPLMSSVDLPKQQQQQQQQQQQAVEVDDVGEFASAEKKKSKSWRRNRTSHAAIDRILSTLLIEIDGIRKHLQPTERILRPDSISTNNALPADEPAVVVIATTTNAALIDRSLKRPGRLEELITLRKPNYSERKAALSTLILNINNSKDCVIDEDTLNQIAERTENKTFADLKVLVQEASMKIIRSHLVSQLGHGNLLEVETMQISILEKQNVCNMIVANVLSNLISS